MNLIYEACRSASLCVLSTVVSEMRRGVAWARKTTTAPRPLVLQPALQLARAPPVDNLGTGRSDDAGIVSSCWRCRLAKPSAQRSRWKRPKPQDLSARPTPQRKRPSLPNARATGPDFAREDLRVSNTHAVIAQIARFDCSSRQAASASGTSRRGLDRPGSGGTPRGGLQADPGARGGVGR